MLNSHRQTANTATVVTVIFVDVLQSETVVLVPKPQPLPKHWQRSELKTSVFFLGALMQAAQSSFSPCKRAGVCHTAASTKTGAFVHVPSSPQYFFIFFLTAIWNHKEIKGIK